MPLMIKLTFSRHFIINMYILFHFYNISLQVPIRQQWTIYKKKVELNLEFFLDKSPLVFQRPEEMEVWSSCTKPPVYYFV